MLHRLEMSSAGWTQRSESEAFDEALAGVELWGM